MLTTKDGKGGKFKKYKIEKKIQSRWVEHVVLITLL